MYPSVAWIRRGVAKSFPARQEINDDELLEKLELSRRLAIDEWEEKNEADSEDDMQEDGSKKEIDEDATEASDSEEEDSKPLRKRKTKKKKREKEDASDDIDRKYGFDTYDDEEEAGGLFLRPDQLMYHNEGEKDPYLEEGGSDVDEDEMDDMIIRPEDPLLLAVCCEEDEYSHLDVKVYEVNENNLYPHHDLPIPAMPLCVEWMSPGGKNLCAIGTFLPEIEVWDLDMRDALIPAIRLEAGSAPLTKSAVKRLRKKGQTPPPQSKGHTDAVLGLSWNTVTDTFLASASADQSVKVWDLTKAEAMLTLAPHSDKVQCVEFHPIEATLLLSGSFDSSIGLSDVRTTSQCIKWKVDSEVECLSWRAFPHSQHFFASTDSGNLYLFDARNTKKPLQKVEAHSKGCTAMTANPKLPGIVATGSPDKTLKLWNFDAEGGAVECAYQHQSNQGGIFSLAWDVDTPFLLGVGGKDRLEVVNCKSLPEVSALWP